MCPFTAVPALRMAAQRHITALALLACSAAASWRRAGASTAVTNWEPGFATFCELPSLLYTPSVFICIVNSD